MKDRALWMVAEHRSDYSSVTAVAKAVADQLGIEKETVRKGVFRPTSTPDACPRRLVDLVHSITGRANA